MEVSVEPQVQNGKKADFEGSTQERVYGAAPREIPGVNGQTAHEEPPHDHNGSPDRTRRTSKAGRNKVGYVYLIGPVDGCYKIGKSKDPAQRVKAFNLPVGTIEHVISSAVPYRLESFIHLAFSHRRVRGEWFRLDESEIAAFKSVAHADTPDDLPLSIIALSETNELLFPLVKSGRGRPSKLPTGPRRTVRCVLVNGEIQRLREACEACDLSQLEFSRAAVMNAVDAVLGVKPPTPPPRKK